MSSDSEKEPLICAACNVELAPQKTFFKYLGHSFSADMPGRSAVAVISAPRKKRTPTTRHSGGRSPPCPRTEAGKGENSRALRGLSGSTGAGIWFCVFLSDYL